MDHVKRLDWLDMYFVVKRSLRMLGIVLTDAVAQTDSHLLLLGIELLANLRTVSNVFV